MRLLILFSASLPAAHDMVLFLHTKRASKPFESLAGLLRWYFGGRLLTCGPQLQCRGQPTHGR
jgi:hypothetical protein